MKYFCSKCEWEGDKPKIQFTEEPDMSFGSYIACPMCYGRAHLTDPKKMQYGHKYAMGSFYIRWD